MELDEEVKRIIKEELLEKYRGDGMFGSYELAEMIIDDFIDSIEEYDKETHLSEIVNNITGNDNGSYTCSTYKSAEIIFENIFEFNELVEEYELRYAKLNVSETERNLVCVLLYICENTILDLGFTTLGEFIENFEQ